MNLGDNLYSLLYRNDKNEAILRVYNPDSTDKKVKISNSTSFDILGNKEIEDKERNLLKAYEIKTYKLEI